MNALVSVRRFDAGWEVAGLRDSTLFFQNVGSLLPPDALMVLEEGSMAPDVRRVVDAHAVEPTAVVPHTTAWPRSRMHWIRPSTAALSALAELTRGHAEPEMCDHIYAVSSGRLVLFWHDAFDVPLYISGEISADRVARFCKEVGREPRWWHAG